MQDNWEEKYRRLSRDHDSTIFHLEVISERLTGAMNYIQQIENAVRWKSVLELDLRRDTDFLILSNTTSIGMGKWSKKRNFWVDSQDKKLVFVPTNWVPMFALPTVVTNPQVVPQPEELTVLEDAGTA